MKLELEIQPLVDQLVLEHGRYRPVDLLQRCGLLRCSDYESWRQAKHAVLEDFLEGRELPRIRNILQAAADYARGIGLTDCLESKAGESRATQTLRYSHDSRFESLYDTQFEPAPSRQQFDLFLDTRHVVLANDLTDALLEKRLQDAEHTLRQWSHETPDEPRLEGYNLLLETQRKAAQPISDVEAVFHTLQTQIVPQARELLGTRAWEYLTPLWRHLIPALEGRRFDPRNPDFHASYAALQLFDWRRVKNVVEAERDYLTEPVLLTRHAEACERLDDTSGWLSDWCRLCWDFESHASEALDSVQGMRLKLNRFWDAFKQLEYELTVADFPAYLISVQPDLARFAFEPNGIRNVQPLLIFELVVSLTLTRNKELDAERIMQRKRLKHEHPVFFEYFLNLCRDPH
jgi:hypothetical protein